MAQALICCGTQLVVSVVMDAVCIVSAALSAVQRWMMGTLLAALAIRMVADAHR